MDSSQYKAWGISYGNGVWLIKLADYSNSDPYGGEAVPISFISSSDGSNWSAPQSSGLTAFQDYSLSYCSLSKV